MPVTTAHLKFDYAGDKVAGRVTKMRSSAVRDLFAAASRSDIISLSGGMPDVSLLPEDAVLATAQAALGDLRATALQYGPTNGREETREALAALMRDTGIRCKADDLMITTGAQEALDLIAKTFIDPGDVIITEGPTYLGALQAFSAYEPTIVTVPFDEQGMKMDLLEEELKKLGKGAVKFLYTIPNFQNPGGVTMSRERRERLLELAHEYDFMVIEDDPYGRLRYDGGHQIPLRAMDENVIYLGTVSKTFAPGLRTGWIIAPKAVLSKINLVKQGTDLCGPALNQIMVEHYFTSINWEKILRGFIDTYAVRRDAMLAALDEFFPEEATWTHPEGGFFVWVTLPEYVDTDSMLSVALENGVTYTPGSGFYPAGQGGTSSMRLAFCYEDPENLREAIRRLAEVIEERLELYRVFLDAGAI